MHPRRPAWIFTALVLLGSYCIFSVLLKRRPLYKGVPTYSASWFFLHPTPTCETKCKQAQQRGLAVNVVIEPPNWPVQRLKIRAMAAFLSLFLLQHCWWGLCSPDHRLSTAMKAHCIYYLALNSSGRSWWEKTCRKLSNLHIPESARFHWWVNSTFTEGTKEKQFWKQTDFFSGIATHFTRRFCRVKPNSQSDIVNIKVSAKPAPSESSMPSSHTHIWQLQQPNPFSCARACWSCRFRPALWEGAPSPSGSHLPRTHYPKSSRGVQFLAQTWEQEGALQDVRVPAHVLQRNTKAAQTRDFFPTPPKKTLAWYFLLKLDMNSISLLRDGVREGRICASHHPSHFISFSKGKKGKKKVNEKESGIAW